MKTVKKMTTRELLSEYKQHNVFLNGPENNYCGAVKMRRYTNIEKALNKKGYVACEYGKMRKYNGR